MGVATESNAVPQCCLGPAAAQQLHRQHVRRRAAFAPGAARDAPPFFFALAFGGVRPGIGGDSALSQTLASSRLLLMSLSFTALSN